MCRRVRAVLLACTIAAASTAGCTEHNSLVGPEDMGVISWTVQTVASVSHWNDVAYADGLYVAFGNAGEIYWSDDDGVTWTPAASSSFGSTLVKSGGYAPFLDTWFAIGGEGKVAYARDPRATWTQVVSPFSDIVTGFAAGPDKVVISSTGGKIATSTDGRTWRLEASPFAGDYHGRVAYWPERRLYMAMVDRQLATSLDAAVWTLRASGQPVGAFLLKIATSATTAVAVGEDANFHGVVSTSRDGLSWTAGILFPLEVGSLFGLGYGGETVGFLAAGQSTQHPTTVIRSVDDGATWVPGGLEKNSIHTRGAAASSTSLIVVGDVAKIARGVVNSP